MPNLAIPTAELPLVTRQLLHLKCLIHSTQKGGCVISRHRGRKQEALTDVAAKRAKQLGLRRSFDTFGNGLKPHRATQLDHSLGNQFLARIDRQPTHKRPINLQHINRVMLQVG